MKKPKELAVSGFEASGLGYGDIMNHSDVDGWSGIEFPDLGDLSPLEQKKRCTRHAIERMSIMDHLRDHMLLTHLMYLESINGIGYRIVQPAQQTDVAVRKGMRRVQKALFEANRGLEYVNHSLLTTEEREHNITKKVAVQGISSLFNLERQKIGIE